MTSNTRKQLAAIAALTASLVMMGGTAFASSASGAAGSADHTTGLIPGPIGDASTLARDTVADVRNQIHRQQW